ncbi:MAG: cytochrome-c oxidase, cbb3-type subunit II [Rhodospirillales bacterium]|jgi:cytochrome c oxidase cbb3-type subunit 2|nr:cytochrome-c oxidase, cbb3-type subunit II [Rhodospirillales bacterium]MDK9721386.1 cytochrome-c oxidase, cbb3-type subunit II [Rhodospirillales bacterium]
MFSHKIFETNTLALIVGIVLSIAAGGLVEIIPLFTIENTIEKVEGMRPYSPLELAGRGIYVREGCYNCHSQMIRPFRDEVERYGHYSLAAESQYDHPFQWSSKRTGPDLARVGGKYSNEWHFKHMVNPRSVVSQSIMPTYAHMQRPLNVSATIAGEMKTLRLVGTPYTDEQIANAVADLEAQATGGDAAKAVEARYPKAKTGDFDGNPDKLTEMDAMIAYLQMLGTLVDFKSVKPELVNR